MTAKEIICKAVNMLLEATLLLAEQKSAEAAVQEQLRRNCETLADMVVKTFDLV